MRTYISLPISGHPIREVERRIERAKKHLRKMGHEPVSPLDPAVNPDHSLPYNVLLGNDIAALLECDAVLFLDGWTASQGCTLEMKAAEIYGKEILFEYQLKSDKNGPEQIS